MNLLVRHKEISQGISQNSLLHLHQVAVDYAFAESIFSAHFVVKKKKPYFWLTDQNFSSNNNKNWGLWNFDVVEVFLQPRREITHFQAPYIELQVSPLNQGFNLNIIEPRKIYYTPLDLNFYHETFLAENETHYGWETKLSVQLPEDVKYLFGNCYACLGQGENREYFGLNLKPSSNPDFHCPDYFILMNEGL